VAPAAPTALPSRSASGAVAGTVYVANGVAAVESGSWTSDRTSSSPLVSRSAPVAAAAPTRQCAAPGEPSMGSLNVSSVSVASTLTAANSGGAPSAAATAKPGEPSSGPPPSEATGSAGRGRDGA